MPNNATCLFDDDADVEMASIRFYRSRSRYSTSSGVSRPPTSESEGPLFGLGEDGGDNEEELEVPAWQPSNKPKKLGKRDTALKSEVHYFSCSFIQILLT
jgi:hypothetical protein